MWEKEQEECFLYTARIDTGPVIINYSDWFDNDSSSENSCKSIAKKLVFLWQGYGNFNL